MKVSVKALEARAEKPHRGEPMLGHRGCRLNHLPEIATEMQVRAIFEAAVASIKKASTSSSPEIM